MTFVIAVDGHAASGKGTISKGVAEHFDFSYLDTGLIYRAVAQIALKRSKTFPSAEELIKIACRFKAEYLQLDGLRSQTVGVYASKIAAVPEVRAALVNFQRNFVLNSDGAILDGRDIGSVIFPDAQLKIFITARLNIRAERRFKEFLTQNIDVKFDEVMRNLAGRDDLDSNRQHAPLKISSDAHLIDTSELSIETSIAKVVNLVNMFKDIK